MHAHIIPYWLIYLNKYLFHRQGMQGKAADTHIQYTNTSRIFLLITTSSFPFFMVPSYFGRLWLSLVPFHCMCTDIYINCVVIWSQIVCMFILTAFAFSFFSPFRIHRRKFLFCHMKTITPYCHHDDVYSYICVWRRTNCKTSWTDAGEIHWFLWW